MDSASFSESSDDHDDFRSASLDGAIQNACQLMGIDHTCAADIDVHRVSRGHNDQRLLQVNAAEDISKSFASIGLAGHPTQVTRPIIPTSHQSDVNQARVTTNRQHLDSRVAACSASNRTEKSFVPVPSAKDFPRGLSDINLHHVFDSPMMPLDLSTKPRSQTSYLQQKGGYVSVMENESSHPQYRQQLGDKLKSLSVPSVVENDSTDGFHRSENSTLLTTVRRPKSDSSYRYRETLDEETAQHGGSMSPVSIKQEPCECEDIFPDNSVAQELTSTHANDSNHGEKTDGGMGAIVKEEPVSTASSPQSNSSTQRLSEADVISPVNDVTTPSAFRLNIEHGGDEDDTLQRALSILANCNDLTKYNTSSCSNDSEPVAYKTLYFHSSDKVLPGNDVSDCPPQCYAIQAAQDNSSPSSLVSSQQSTAIVNVEETSSQSESDAQSVSASALTDSNSGRNQMCRAILTVRPRPSTSSLTSYKAPRLVSEQSKNNKQDKLVSMPEKDRTNSFTAFAYSDAGSELPSLDSIRVHGDDSDVRARLRIVTDKTVYMTGNDSATASEMEGDNIKHLRNTSSTAFPECQSGHRFGSSKRSPLSEDRFNTTHSESPSEGRLIIVTDSGSEAESCREILSSTTNLFISGSAISNLRKSKDCFENGSSPRYQTQHEAAQENCPGTADTLLSIEDSFYDADVSDDEVASPPRKSPRKDSGTDDSTIPWDEWSVKTSSYDTESSSLKVKFCKVNSNAQLQSSEQQRSGSHKALQTPATKRSAVSVSQDVHPDVRVVEGGNAHDDSPVPVTVNSSSPSIVEPKSECVSCPSTPELSPTWTTTWAQSRMGERRRSITSSQYKSSTPVVPGDFRRQFTPFSNPNTGTKSLHKELLKDRLSKAQGSDSLLNIAFSMYDNQEQPVRPLGEENGSTAVNQPVVISDLLTGKEITLIPTSVSHDEDREFSQSRNQENAKPNVPSERRETISKETMKKSRRKSVGNKRSKKRSLALMLKRQIFCANSKNVSVMLSSDLTTVADTCFKGFARKGKSTSPSSIETHKSSTANRKSAPEKPKRGFTLPVCGTSTKSSSVVTLPLPLPSISEPLDTQQCQTHLQTTASECQTQAFTPTTELRTGYESNCNFTTKADPFRNDRVHPETNIWTPVSRFFKRTEQSEDSRRFKSMKMRLFSSHGTNTMGLVKREDFSSVTTPFQIQNVTNFSGLPTSEHCDVSTFYTTEQHESCNLSLQDTEQSMEVNSRLVGVNRMTTDKDVVFKKPKSPVVPKTARQRNQSRSQRNAGTNVQGTDNKVRHTGSLMEILNFNDAESVGRATCELIAAFVADKTMSSHSRRYKAEEERLILKFLCSHCNVHINELTFDPSVITITKTSESRLPTERDLQRLLRAIRRCKK